MLHRDMKKFITKLKTLVYNLTDPIRVDRTPRFEQIRTLYKEKLREHDAKGEKLREQLLLWRSEKEDIIAERDNALSREDPNYVIVGVTEDRLFEILDRKRRDSENETKDLATLLSDDDREENIRELLEGDF
jgi:hypothetical protein